MLCHDFVLGAIFCGRRTANGACEKCPRCGLRVRHELESRRQMAYIDFGQNLQEKEVEVDQAHSRILSYPKRHRELIKSLR